MIAGKKLIGVLVGVMLLAACGNDPEPTSTSGEALDKVTFMLGTRPSQGAAPWFLGIEKGFFEEAGIDLEVLPSDSPSAGMANVIEGRAEFASVDFTTLGLAKTDDPENDMRIITITYTRPPYAIYSMKSGANAATPEDLSGKAIYGPAGSSMLKIFQVWLEDQGIENVKFEEIDSASREPLLLAGEIGVIAGFSTSIPPLQQAAARQDDEVVVIEPADHGLETFYASGLAGTKTFIESNEDLTRRFVEAHLRSFEYAFENPEEAAQVLFERYPELEPDLTVAGMEILEKQMTNDGQVEDIGVIDPEKVQITIDYAKDILGIEADPEDLYLTGYVSADR